MTKSLKIKTMGSQLSPRIRRPWQSGPSAYLIAAAAVGVMTGLIHITHADASLVNVPPLYLLAVQAVALLVGSRPAVAAAFLAFLCFDWFFVDPKYQLTVRDPFEFVALCVFLVSAILVGQLTTLFQSRAQEASRREAAASAMARASWAVASELHRDDALHKVLEQLSYIDSVQHAVILVPIAGTQQYETAAEYAPTEDSAGKVAISDDALKFVSTTRQPIGLDDSVHWQKVLPATSNAQIAYLPVYSEGQMLGVFYIALKPGKQWLEAERQVVSSLVNHMAVVLQRDRLFEAQTKAQALAEANRLKTALLQMVSHDFRSPLSSIKASVSSLLVDEGNPIDSSTQHGLLEAIEEEADRLNRLVGNLLDLSRLEANAWQPHKELCSVTELVGAALDSFSKEENERIVVSVESGISDISVDFAQFVQVLRNLVENALKYSPKESKVELVAHSSKGSVDLDILDRGPGLPPGEEHQVFEPFYRAKQHQESSVPGVGMGLAICLGLVQAQGGSLTAYNREGGGALFQVSIPSDETAQRSS